MLLGGSLDAAERILAIVAGLLMIAMALQFFGCCRRFIAWRSASPAAPLPRCLRSLMTARSRAAPLAFGVFNGFLPCPLVYAFAAEAASTGQALTGFLTMASFGLGTFPAMLVMGGIGRVLAPAWRQRGVWLAGSCILLLGIITLGRGLLPFGAHMAHGWSEDIRHDRARRDFAAIACCPSGSARCSAPSMAKAARSAATAAVSLSK